MKNLLVPVDFSEYADNACEYALHIASVFKADITLFHAFHIPIIDPLTPAEYLSDLAESAEKDLRRRMEEAVGKLKKTQSEKKLGDFEIRYAISMGFAADEILNMGIRLQPDFIVMGRRLTQGMGKVLLGSVTSAVLQNASYPVLIVPENVRYTVTPAQVLYAAEYGDADNQTIDQLLQFAKPLKAKVHCVHVADKPNPDAERRLAELEVQYSLDVQQGDIRFSNVTSEHIYEGLSDYAEKNNISVMAMLTRKRNFFVKLFDRSFTNKVAFKTNIPLLVFHH